MSKYILKRNKIDLLVIDWEKLHDENKQTESLPMFIARNQAIFLLNIFIEKGFNPEDAKIELNKILNKGEK
jgi:hypothetical protein